MIMQGVYCSSCGEELLDCGTECWKCGYPYDEATLDIVARHSRAKEAMIARFRAGGNTSEEEIFRAVASLGDATQKAWSVIRNK